jgi:molybdopterin-containing oxidoreductase family membrane subunit
MTYSPAQRDERRQPAGSPVIGPGHTFGTITDHISAIVLAGPTPRGWWIGFGISFLLLMVFFYAIGYLLVSGVGIWGINVPVAWGFAIVNLVWWIGIGHAGTLISAILLLLRQQWRTSINRFAEAMTLFAVACAALFPLLHMGRPGFFYWLVPYPNTMALWPQFRSPLVWDVFAITTYFLVSLLFWYIGLIPDLATLRDRSQRRLGRIAYGVLAMGWRGSAYHWRRYEVAYLLLAGLATPLVVSVHTVVSFDFAVSLLPGWHSTIFPPYFVAGAIYSGFAMVLVLAIPLRRFYRLQDFITDGHLNNMAKVMLATGLIVAYGYFLEGFIAFYSGNGYERFMQVNRMFGPYAAAYWALIACNVILPQVLWSRRVRRSALALFAVSLVVLTGMWLERYVIVITSLHRDFLPSSWGMYSPTIWDWATFVGSIGLFMTLLFLFVRFLPMISIAEMRMLLPEATVAAPHPGTPENLQPLVRGETPADDATRPRPQPLAPHERSVAVKRPPGNLPNPMDPKPHPEQP